MSESRIDQPTSGDPAEAWRKVAAQLRLYRAQEKEAWGAVDEDLLARYYSGSLTEADRHVLDEAGANKKVITALRALEAMRQATPSLAELKLEASQQRAAAEAALAPPAPRWVGLGGALTRVFGAVPTQLAMAACLLLSVSVAAWFGAQNARLSHQLSRADAEEGSRPAVALSASPRQHYSPWVFDQATRAYYSFYFFRSSPEDRDYKYHYVVVPMRQVGQFAYYCNPSRDAKGFWGRLDLSQLGEPRYSLLPPGDRQRVLSEIPQGAFPDPGPMPDIPDSTDGTKMIPPPGPPPKTGQPDLFRLGDKFS